MKDDLSDSRLIYYPGKYKELVKGMKTKGVKKRYEWVENKWVIAEVGFIERVTS